MDIIHFSIPIPCHGPDDDDLTFQTSDILYMELVYVKKSPKIKVHLRENEFYSKISGAIEALEVMLAQFGFVRVDSGIIVNMNHFREFDKTIYGVYILFNGCSKKVKCSRAGHLKAKSILEP